MAQENHSVKERVNIGLRTPRRFTVFIHNDDFTPMNFVVRLLMQVFFKSEQDATSLMLNVHHSDKAPVGSYVHDVALSKVRKAHNMAREKGYPLKLSVKEEE